MTAQPPSCSAEDRPERVAHVRRAAIGLARVARVSPWLLRAGLTPRRLRPPGGRRVLMLTIGDVANDPRVHKVARSLAASEYEVDVLAPALGAAGERTLEPGVRVVEVERKWLWRFFVLYQDEFRAAGLARSFDYVHANDLTTLTVGWVLARIRGVPLVYDAHELWAENVEPSGDGWAPMSSRTRLLARTWERFLLRSVDVAVTVGPSIANELAQRTRDRRPPLLLPNYPSLSLLDAEVQPPTLRADAGVPDSAFVTLYLGGINPLRNIESVIRAHRHLPDDFVFVVRGPGIDAYAAEYRSLARAEGVEDRVIMLPPVGMDEVVGAARGADCGIVMLRNICRNFYLYYPNKLFEYALAGIPIAASDFPDVRRFVVGERCGVTFDPDSPESIARALLWLRAHPDDSREMGERGRASVLRRHNWEASVGGLVNAYERLA